jgi:formylglycine-generating enzyme required for sulfatase activity
LKQRVATAEEAPVPPKELSLDFGGGVRMELVLIPAGEFEMGSNDGEANERPVHKVKISRPFYMGKYVVTKAQYENTMAQNPSKFMDEKLPAEIVAFVDAEEFCTKASKLTGKPIRLPTEAEWEYACRAGTKTKYNTGDNEAALGRAGWFKRNSERTAHPVGQKEPNAFGLYDMHGNVWQWCQDWFGEDYYSKSPAENPQGPAQGALRMLRGGSRNTAASDCRSAFRLGVTPLSRTDNIGFRIVVTLDSTR